MKRFGEIRYLALCLIFAAVLSVPLGSAHAYVGPGLGVGALAVVAGVIGSAIAAGIMIMFTS